MTSLLVLGGAKSGKSRYAEQRASERAGQKKFYIATAQIYEGEFADRITQHQQERAGKGWHTVEEPFNLISALHACDGAEHFILVDCLTLWLSNLLLNDLPLTSAVDELAQTLPHMRATVALVSNEVGMSIVPDNALARRFRDEQGLCNQKIAAVADEVVWVTAGLAMRLKPQPG